MSKVSTSLYKVNVTCAITGKMVYSALLSLNGYSDPLFAELDVLEKFPKYNNQDYITTATKLEPPQPKFTSESVMADVIADLANCSGFPIIGYS